MKRHNYFSNLCIVLFAVVAGCTEYPESAITNPPSVNETSLELFVGGQKQVTANPVGAVYKWTSLNEEVATVSQTGLVQAIGEGLTSLVVESNNDRITIDVRVRTFIPLTGIILSPPKKPWYGEEAQEALIATPVPLNATEGIVWTSSDPNIATVSKRGLFTTGTQEGPVTVTASNADGSISQNVVIPCIINITPVLLDKTGWTVTASSDEAVDNFGPEKIIDGIYINNNSNIWHNQYDGRGQNYWSLPWVSVAALAPHWVVIDMQTAHDVVKVDVLRRELGAGYANTCVFYIGNDDMDFGANWGVEIGRSATWNDHWLTQDVAANGRYLKVLLSDSPNGSLCEVDIYTK
ncbi:bacterial Ig-like domain [Candidatus Symbiothrix dinenymphae]|nr:bacterial Ig-like domain [Candidatus Symbiothrix dinenymphae]